MSRAFVFLVLAGLTLNGEITAPPEPGPPREVKIPEPIEKAPMPREKK